MRWRLRLAWMWGLFLAVLGFIVLIWPAVIFIDFMMERKRKEYDAKFCSSKDGN